MNNMYDRNNPAFQSRMPYGRMQQPQAGCGCSNVVAENTCKKSAKQLLDTIDKVSFAMDDTRLFLDTHPDCSEAKAFFKKMEKIRREAIHDYENNFGPMLAYQTSDASDEVWSWNEGPLPWNNKCCSGRRV
jgi:spore coat protein JB